MKDLISAKEEYLKNLLYITKYFIEFLASEKVIDTKVTSELSSAVVKADLDSLQQLLKTVNTSIPMTLYSAKVVAQNLRHSYSTLNEERHVNTAEDSFVIYEGIIAISNFLSNAGCTDPYISLLSRVSFNFPPKNHPDPGPSYWEPYLETLTSFSDYENLLSVATD